MPLQARWWSNSSVLQGSGREKQTAGDVLGFASPAPDVHARELGLVGLDVCGLLVAVS